MLFVPKWFAHGFLTLEDNTEFLYQCDDYYDPGFEFGLMWNDAELAIDWQEYLDEYEIDALEISEKDKKNMNFNTYMLAPIF